MDETIAIPSRFSGPPGVGNGGYSCGRFAALVGGVAEVTLRRPVPLEKALEVRRDGSSVRILDREELIAEVAPTDLSGLEAPARMTLEQAVVGASHFPFTEHPFPTCFVCGPRRERFDGLRIHAYRAPGGPSASKDVASPWVPSPDLADQTLSPGRGEGKVRGEIPPEIIWASLDCPTGWAGIAEIPGGVAVLGRLAVRIDRPVIADRAHVLVAGLAGRDGRKLRAIGGLYTADGALCAVSRATWILVDPGKG